MVLKFSNITEYLARQSEKPKMVSWYDPRQLLDTARKTFISKTIGENADPRLVAASTTTKKIFDYSHELERCGDYFAPHEKCGEDFRAVPNRPREEIWIDYVADVGDGFNSTYAVAYYLAQENLRVEGAQETLKRGDVLIFGGDAVYPTATPELYRTKLVRPYAMAFRASGTQNDPARPEADLAAEPHVFALPGNHDWYDSLVAFQRVFCTYFYNNRFFGGWRTRQEISYWALKLPHKWWLVGVDFQLSSSLDVRQLEYLESVIKKMDAGDKMILCVPEPYWVKAIKYQDVTDMFEEKEESLERLEKLLADQQVEIKMYVAGDLHHYRRFEAGDGSRVQKITCGGGGAFLHPTHDYDFTRRDKENKSKGFNWQKNYPSSKRSKQLDWQNLLLFGSNNRSFGFVTAILYAFIAWLVHGRVDGEFTILKTFHVTLIQLVDQPLATLVIVFLLMTLGFFTDSKSKLYKWIGAFAHGLAHLGAIFIIGWFAYYFTLLVLRKETIDTYGDNLIWFVCVVAVASVGGYFIGSLIMGVYLFVSLHVFGRHDNEAFSALKIEDFKSFLRLHIDKNGDLTIYPIKLERVPRKWNEVVDEKGKTAYYTPADGTSPELIEQIPTIPAGKTI